MGKRTRNDIKKELDKITDTIDINVTNEMLELGGMKDFQITKKTLQNISAWALDGKSQVEIRNNLELNDKEWSYLIKVCPIILVVMQHSQAYAEIVLTGALYQTAIGGYKVKKKQPIKIKEYEIVGDKSIVVGEHIEYAEWDEEQPPNPNLLKYLAEHKLSEQFGETKVDNSKEHRQVVDNMNPETLQIIEALGEKDE